MTDRTTAHALGALAFTAALVLAAAGTPTTGAFYRNTAAGNQNTLQGETLDVKLAESGPTNGQGSTTDESDADAVSDTFEDTAHSTLGADNLTNTLTLGTDASTVGADAVDVDVAFSENDSGGTAGNAGDTAATLEVTALQYGGTDLTGELADENGNGQLDVEDLTLGSNPDTLSGRAGVATGASVGLTLAVSGSDLDSLAVASGDGVDVTVTLTARAAGFADADQSTDNTIQYG